MLKCDRHKQVRACQGTRAVQTRPHQGVQACCVYDLSVRGHDHRVQPAPGHSMCWSGFLGRHQRPLRKSSLIIPVMCRRPIERTVRARAA